MFIYVIIQLEVIKMVNDTKLNESKLFKNGNSWAIRIPKKDKEKLHADDNTVFERKISDDGKTIMFTKVEKVDPEIFNYLDKQYDKHKGLMDRLKNI